MHVCLVTSVPLPPEEGVGYYVWNLAHQLRCKGHEVQIITRGRTGRTTCECLNGITIWRPIYLPLYPLHVHFHSLFVNRLVARLEPEVDIFHLHSPLPPPLHTARPLLLTVHTPMRADGRSLALRDLHSLLIKLQTPVSCRLEQRLLHTATNIAAVSHSVAGELGEYGIPPSRVQVLGNGVDHVRFSPVDLGPADPPYILSVGRLEHRKGFEDLIDCARLVCMRNNRVQFRIAGTGPLEGKLREEIQAAGLQGRVLLLGHVADRPRMIRLYQRATIFVHAAHREGLPTVVLEAMACARPVVATAVSGALDVIVAEENGLLVPPHEPSQMARAIDRLLDAPYLRAGLGRAARSTIESRFSWDVVSQKYIGVYRRLLDGANKKLL
jgi:glycosyltransferase involved in cell wall biosynthesis